MRPTPSLPNCLIQKWRQNQPGTCGGIRPHRPGRRQKAQTAETGENRASRRCSGHASKCARPSRKTRAGHASTDHCAGEQCHAATKRRFSIPFTRTAHRQCENDDSKQTGRIRGAPEIASELTPHRKQSGDAPEPKPAPHISAPRSFKPASKAERGPHIELLPASELNY